MVTGSGGVVVSMDGLAEEDEDQEADGDTRMHDRLEMTLGVIILSVTLTLTTRFMTGFD